MLDEIKFNTRGDGVARDFRYFAVGGVNESWKEKYKKAFFNAENNFHLFADIENDEYRLYFEKIPRPWTITRGGALTQPFVALLSVGKCGSDSARAMFKIVTNFFFGNGKKVEELFAETIPQQYIEDNFDKCKTEEVEKEIAQKLETIVSALPDVSFPREQNLQDNKYIFDDFEKNKNAFFSELERITEANTNDSFISLVLTEKNIGKFLDKEFDHKVFNKGLCLTTGTIDGGRIEKTIKEVKVEKPKPVETKIEEKEKKANAPFLSEGTTSEEKRKTKVKDLEKQLSKILSNPGYRKLLIISAFIILTLIVAVKSCWNHSGNNSEQKSPEQKEQQCSPQSHDSCKKSSTDTLKIKANSCKTTQDTLDIKADSLKK